MCELSVRNMLTFIPPFFPFSPGTNKLGGETKLCLCFSVRENLITTITRKFVDEMKVYQQTQQNYKTDIKKKAKRQIQVIKPDATDEEVEEVMKAEGGRDALMKQAVLERGVNDQIQ